MGHTSATRAAAYGRVRQRRIDWFAENGPCRCGSWDKLELHHVDRSRKIDHRVWSWSEARRIEELAKCIALCAACHDKQTASDIHGPRQHGTATMYKNERCRCAECVANDTGRKRRWRASKIDGM